MRQGQQGRRGRGRGRKSQSPLTRNYESNGPDVKIRGTAAHIAEKYMSLARDALASGDTVAAENYLQHAEHYNRIIMAAQAQMQSHGGQQQDGPNGGGGYRPRWMTEQAEAGEEAEAEEAETMGAFAGGRGNPRRNPNGPDASAREGDGNSSGSAETPRSDENTPDRTLT